MDVKKEIIISILMAQNHKACCECELYFVINEWKWNTVTLTRNICTKLDKWNWWITKY